MPEKGFLQNDSVSHEEAIQRVPSPQGRIESDIVAHIRCEIGNGVREALLLGKNVQWLKGWGSTVTLKLTVDEQSTLNPTASLITPLVAAQTFALNLGATGTSHATRLETITFTYANSDLIAEVDLNRRASGLHSCDTVGEKVAVSGDLKIGQFIYDKAVIAAVGEAGNKGPATPPFSVLSEDITFVLSYGGSVSPSWKLTRVLADPSSALFSTTRSNTNDVLITLGPVATPATAKAQATLTIETQVIHNAFIFGGAAGSSVRSLTP